MKRWIVLGILLIFCRASEGLELFAKGSLSKANHAADKHTITLTAATGFAFNLLSWVRLEARYTNVSALQNKLEVVQGSTLLGTLTDIKTETAIYSVGVDLTMAGARASFQPFIYLGAGYLESKRSYYFTLTNASTSSLFSEPLETGVSGNVGAGFRIRIAPSFAFEVEAYAYALHIDKPDPRINAQGSVGIRIFI